MDSCSDDEQEEIQKVEYDHFDPQNMVWYPKIPEEWKYIAKEKQFRKNVRGVFLGRSDLLKILRRKLLEHKWEEASMIMEGLASIAVKRSSGLGDVFWKVGNEVLYKHFKTAGEEDLASQHKEAVMAVHAGYLDQTQVLYEYAMHLMARREFKKARDALKFFRNVKLYNAHKVLGDVKEWEPAIEGYLGMLDYISWKEMASNQSSWTDFDEDLENQDDASTAAEEAIAHFETTLATPGVWDVFVTKYVEIMEHFGRISEAEETLRANSLKNPNNPNAHKYWYEFLLKHPEIEENTEARTQALSNLHEIDPSDVHMLDLHCLRMEAAFKVGHESEHFVIMVSMALGILLDMLDYEMWIQHVKSWRMLADSLRKVKTAVDKKSFKTVLETIWIAPMRHTWWHKYHFTKRRASEAMNADTEFALSKDFVAKVLVGSQCEFCEYMSQNDSLFHSPRKRRRLQKALPAVSGPGWW